MGDAFIVKSARGSGRLELVAEEPDPPFRRLNYLVVTLCSESLRATARVYNDHHGEGVQGLLRFFEDLAANWKGWPGEKCWESIEGDFKLACRSDGLGHVEINVYLSSVVTDPAGWEVRCELTVEAGQLDSLAEDAGKFFRA